MIVIFTIYSLWYTVKHILYNIYCITYTVYDIYCDFRWNLPSEKISSRFSSQKKSFFLKIILLKFHNCLKSQFPKVWVLCNNMGVHDHALRNFIPVSSCSVRSFNVIFLPGFQKPADFKPVDFRSLNHYLILSKVRSVIICLRPDQRCLQRSPR